MSGKFESKNGSTSFDLDSGNVEMKNTEWTPSPQDLANKIVVLEGEVTSLEVTVTDLQAQLNVVVGQLNSIESAK